MKMKGLQSLALYIAGAVESRPANFTVTSRSSIERVWAVLIDGLDAVRYAAVSKELTALSRATTV